MRSRERALRFEVHDDVPADAGRIVDDGIGAFNTAAAPLGDVKRLSCFARVPDGEVVGGAVGRTWGECRKLQQLWVSAARRREGIGAALLAHFETRAAQRGCRTVYLDTFSFQAPEFYRGLGYAVAAEIRGFPDGIVKHLMVKPLRVSAR